MKKEKYTYDDLFKAQDTQRAGFICMVVAVAWFLVAIVTICTIQDIIFSLSKGAIGAIVGGSLGFAIILALVGYLLWRHGSSIERQFKEQQEEEKREEQRKANREKEVIEILNDLADIITDMICNYIGGKSEVLIPKSNTQEREWLDRNWNRLSVEEQTSNEMIEEIDNMKDFVCIEVENWFESDNYKVDFRQLTNIVDCFFEGTIYRDLYKKGVIAL